MRILSVTHFFASHGGGIELVAGHLDRELSALRHDTRWAAADEGARAGADDARRIKLQCVDWLERFTGLPMPIPLPGSIGRLWQAVAASDAVIVHDALYISSILAVVAARYHRKRVLMIQHIAEIPFASPVMRAIMALAIRLVTKPMLRAVDQVVFISATVRDKFAHVALRSPPRLLFNGVDAAIFRPAQADERLAVREAHQLAPRRTMLFVGRFVEKKGLAVLSALARLRPDLEFVLVGRGPIDPDSWGLSNVRTLPYQTPDALADLYRAADVLLLPSVGEGFPLVVQEAMASGLPVVCGADTAHADPAATNWLAGIDVDLTDVGATADRASSAIDRLAMPASERAAIAAYAANTYSWNMMAQSVVALLEAAARRR